MISVCGMSGGCEKIREGEAPAEPFWMTRAVAQTRRKRGSALQQLGRPSPSANLHSFSQRGIEL